MAIINGSVGIDNNLNQEWKIYSLPMDEEFLGSIKYDASLPIFIEGKYSGFFRGL